MSRGTSEIQNELERANTYETEGNFEKAAKCYFKAANLAAEDEQSLKLFNKAFFTSRKSGQTPLMFKMGKAYYEMLTHWGLEKKVNELIPTFLEVSGRMKDLLMESQLSEEIVDVSNWMIELYNLTGNTEAAFDISQQTGDIITTVGQKILSGSYRIGKEEKYSRGLELLDDAIQTYQKIRLDKPALEKILAVRIVRIGCLIDIGKYAEGIEETLSLINFYDSQDKIILPYSKEELSFRVAQLLAKKCLLLARNKQFNISESLTNSAITSFETAGKYLEIPPFLWELAIIHDETKQKDSFFRFVDKTIDLSQKYEDQELPQQILTYLETQGREICNGIINSRRLMIQKAPIEFNNSEGVQYILKAIDLSKKLTNKEAISNILEYLFQYAQDMYTKKLTKRSLPYFEFTARVWFDIDEVSKSQMILDTLDRNYQELLESGKFEETSAHLGSILSIKTFSGDAESAGETAFSFAQTAATQGKGKTEIKFLVKAYDAFSVTNSIPKLQEMLTYIIEQSDALYTLDKKTEERREKLLNLGERIASSISEETYGEFLKATSLKALNSGLQNLGINKAEQAFVTLKNFDQQAAADLYFRVGTVLLQTNREKAIEFISQSTQYAADFESLNDIVERNLNFLNEQALRIDELSFKLFFVNKLELITESINRQKTFSEFLFTFVQNLAEKANEPEFFSEMKKYLSKAFEEFYKQDKEHAKLSEISRWTHQHILDMYPENQQSQMYELALQSLEFHEKMSETNNFLKLFWNLFEKFISTENFALIIEFYKQTYLFLERLNQPDSMKQEFTEKIVTELNRSVKPKIQEEDFNVAWKIVKDLFTNLIDTGFQSRAISLYQENAALFAPYRLDLALTMWAYAIKAAKLINNSEPILDIGKTIINEIIPIYIEKDNSSAVNQLYTQAINAYESAEKKLEMLDLYTKAAKFSLSFGDFISLQIWGDKGIDLATNFKNDAVLFDFSDMYFGVGRGMLSENPEIGLQLITTVSDKLRNYGPTGFDYYCVKMGEIYEDLYNFPQTTSLAQDERSRILQHFRESGRRKEEGNFLITTAKLGFQAGNVNEGLDLISNATEIFRELEDEEGLSDIVSICLKTAANYSVSSSEYQLLSNHASQIQSSGVVISEEKTQEAYTDLFDGLLDDMTELMDPKKRKERQQKK
ncbi:MAG: hypothetical protein ACFE95_10970 [Candidatus Hodarchaeota archaeon]